ncbi:sodium channel protein Nach isoform X2 [Halyomorpha halys]|uniref:sodium channel protein Nach isoform X2 n=1 Tax=Halyomorpha halys TaxID=286706 RepID=UPI0034D2D485
MFPIQEFLKHALKFSSLKCFYYTLQPTRHPIERVFWIAWCFLMFLAAAWLSLCNWDRYQKNPTVISLERNYLDWNTTLSALTLCPRPGLDQAAVLRVARYPKDVEKGVEFLNALANWTYPNLGQIPNDHEFEPSLYQQMLMYLRVNFSHNLPNLPSSQKLSLSMTEVGICYSLNSQLAFYADPRYWMSNNWNLRKPVILIHGNPLDVAEMSVQVNDIKVSFNAYLHDGEETIDGSSNLMFPVGFQEAMYLDICALSTYSTEATRTLSVQQRKCRFIEESNLEISPVYSYRLCQSECRMHLSLKLCGCIPYFYRNTGKYKVCGPSGMNCLDKYKERLLKLRDGNKREVCDCIQNCNFVNVWTTRILQGAWDRDTIVRLSLDSYPRYRLKRDIFYSFGDLLAQMGGTTGLCFGCSVLSIFELFYIITMRLFFFIKNKEYMKPIYS